MERTLRSTLPEGKFVQVSLRRRNMMRSIPSLNARSTERRFRMTLVRLGIAGWKLHPIDLPARPDVYFPRQKLAVFLDGCFWHGCSRCGHLPRSNHKFWSTKFALNKARDRRDNARLRRSGIEVLRLWEHDLAAGNWVKRLMSLRAARHVKRIAAHRSLRVKRVVVRPRLRIRGK